MNQFIQSIIAFLSLIQPSPELFAEWRGAITFDRVLVVSSLVGSVVWWRYQRGYCVQLQEQYSELLKEHRGLASRLIGLESGFQKIQKTAAQALTAQNVAIKALSISCTEQFNALATSAKQTADLTTILTSSAAKHEKELGLLMQIREQLLGIAKNQSAQIDELRGEIERIKSSTSATGSAPEQQKIKKGEAAKVHVSVEENQITASVYSESFDKDSKTAEVASRLNSRPLIPKNFPVRVSPSLGQGTTLFSGNNILNFFPNPPNYSGTN